jgi:hypothetical protein
MAGTKISNNKVAIILVCFIVVGGFLIFSNPKKCDSTDSVEASIIIKEIGGRTMIGLNADTDSLKFGVVSPGIIARRSIFSEYSNSAQVIVTMQGDLNPWTTIDREQFHIDAGGREQVYFNVKVPLGTPDGNYTGRANFCFKDTS